MPYKICPTCHEKNGVRSLSCKGCNLCFAEVQKKDAKPVEVAVYELPVDKMSYEKNMRIVLIPGTGYAYSGHWPPVKPKGDDADSIHEWLLEICEYGKSKNPGEWYTVMALEYFAALIWKRNSPLFKSVCLEIAKFDKYR